jgi:1-acyl-sn-glycerol-3-phosphate acyltransferase
MPALRLFTAMRVTGDERLDHLRPPFLICANHASHLDVPILLAAMPRRLRRRVAVAMQPGYFETYLRGTAGPFERLRLGWAYGLVTLLLHTFPFPRSAAFRVALEYAGEMAGRGWSILVFPEGVLSLDGTMQSFRPGLGVLARELRLRVVPARIEGAFEILPVGGRFPRRLRGPVRVAWGEPMSMAAGEVPGAFAARVQEAVLRESGDRC